MKNIPRILLGYIDQEMLKMGCSDTARVIFAFQSFMKLCEVDKLFDVKFLYNSELDIIYLTSMDGKEQVLHLPAPTNQLRPAWLHTAQLTLRAVHPQATINIMLKTPDSTILPYKLSEGLCPPPTPESTKGKKAHHEKLQYIQSELNKRKVEFYEEAKRQQLQTVNISFKAE